VTGPQRIVVLGATGGCGAHVVRHAAARGHAVTAVIRPNAVFEPPPGHVAVVRGDVLADGVIARAMDGHDAVISCLGIRRRFPRNPWSRLLSPPDLVARTTRSIIAAASASGLSRVLQISAAGVADSAPLMNWVMRFLVKRSKIGVAYRDLAVAEDHLATSTLDWTAVRPVTLSPGKPKRVITVPRFGLTALISREAVALWLLDHLASDPTSRTPMIAHGDGRSFVTSRNTGA
jgi:putative NADH-flavin reductase